MIAVTLSTLILNHLMEQICTLYALNFFIVESGNCLGKKYVRGWKMHFRGFKKVNTKHSSKVSDFSIITSFLTLTDFLLGLIDQFTGRKRECCTFRPDDYYYLILFNILFFDILSSVLLLNDCLERWNPHIIAKLDKHITCIILKSFFNAFELIMFIRHFCDTCILHVFEIYTNVSLSRP